MPRTTFTAALHAEVDAALAEVDAALARRHPGEDGTRRPVHTVYVPADAVRANTPATWGRRALAALVEHAPEARTLARVLGVPEALAADVHPRVRAKLAREPVEDLRIDFEDGYGVRPDEEEDAEAVRVARLAAGLAVPFTGIRFKCLEAPVRARGIRTLDIFLTELLARGGLPGGLTLTLPKVTHPRQVAATARLCAAFERAHGLPERRLGFEIQIETPQAVLGPDGKATVVALVAAADGRATGLHYGTYDYSAALGVAPAHQSLDHPAADHAKAVMQLAAAGTGVRLSDGSTNVLPVGTTEQVHHAWRLHHDLVRRSLARAYYQGWDLHPAQLVTRYAAVFAFHRESLPRTAARLAAYVGRAGGGVLDEPASARALAAHVLRGVDCGAVDAAEAEAATGLDRPSLLALARAGTL
ncbi:aldolase/citrate lyase family protein [Streptomyces capparidis]